MDEDSIPTTEISKDEFPMPVWKLFVRSGLCKSGNEAKRLIQQGGAYIKSGGDWIRIKNENIWIDRVDGC